MKEIKPGDIIFSYANKNIQAIGMSKSVAKSYKTPDYYKKETNDDNGWKIDVEFQEISNSNWLNPKLYSELQLELKLSGTSPLRADGSANLWYLTQISENSKNIIVQLIGNEGTRIFNDLRPDISKEQKDDDNWLDEVELTKIPLPAKKPRPTGKRSSPKRKKISWKEKQENDEKVGRAGEKAVFKHELKEVRQLSDELSDEKLLERVTHVSIEDDTLGYDILSVTRDKKDKFIEVKTTTNVNDCPFFITDKEIEFSKKYSEQYSIYRVLGYGPKNINLKYFEIGGDITKFCTPKPILYQCDLND